MAFVREPLTARVDALGREIDEDEVRAQILQILRPAAETGRDLEDRARRKECVDARQQAAVPERRRPAPPGRPLVALCRPVPAFVEDLFELVDVAHARMLSRAIP